jgi:predicted nucleic-acid-binding Zn-ribbon protein
MAQSTCPKCDSHMFEAKENSPTGSKYKLIFVQCRKCGAVVGVLDFVNVGAGLEQIAGLLKKR